MWTVWETPNICKGDWKIHSAFARNSRKQKASSFRYYTAWHKQLCKKYCRSLCSAAHIIQVWEFSKSWITAVKNRPFLFLFGWDWICLALHPLFRLLYQFQMTDEDECGAVSGMTVDGGHWSTWRKPAPVPLYPQQIPYNLTWVQPRLSWWEASAYPPELWHGKKSH
jgi:hypothetical protein